MTQIVFDLDALDRFGEAARRARPVPLLVGVFPLTSYRLALRLHNEVPGIVVPQELQDALEAAGAGRGRGRDGARARADRGRARRAATASTSSRRTASRRPCSSYWR